MLTNAVTNLSSIMACKPTLSARCYCHELITCSLSSVVRQTTELLPIADFYRSQLGAPWLFRLIAFRIGREPLGYKKNQQ
jgi:hypothetical protein